MTWSQFLIGVLIAYVIYYLANFLLDAFVNTSKTTTSKTPALKISGNNTPVEISDDEDDILNTGGHVVTQNKERSEKQEISTNLTNTLKEEESNPEQKDQKEEIPPVNMSPSGGVEVKDLYKLCRSEAIKKANQLPFAS